MILSGRLIIVFVILLSESLLCAENIHKFMADIMDDYRHNVIIRPDQLCILLRISHYKPSVRLRAEHSLISG